MVGTSDATKKFQKEMHAGTTALVLLSVLSRSEEPMYGYQIAKMLEESSSELLIMKQGSLYPVLRSLEENEMLKSMVEPSISGPPRRYYRITDEGRQCVKEWTAIWNRMKKFVDANLRG